MNTDIRLPISFKGHPKRKRLEKLMGDRSLGYLIDLWLSAAQYRPDGILRGWDEDDIAAAAGWEDDSSTFADALVKSGWLDKDADQTYILHNWEKYQGWCIGSEHRSNKGRILALIKHHGKEAGCKIAIERFGINPAEYGYGFEEDSMQPACDGHASSNTTCMQAAHTPSPSPSGKLIPLSNDKGIVSKDKIPPCPHEKIIEVYHSILPALSQVRAWPDTSKKHLTRIFHEAHKK